MTPMSVSSYMEAQHQNSHRQMIQTLDAVFRSLSNRNAPTPTVSIFRSLINECEYRKLVHAIKKHQVFEALLNRDCKDLIDCLSKRVEASDKPDVYQHCSGGFGNVLLKAADEGNISLLTIFIRSIPTPQRKLEGCLSGGTLKRTVLDYGAGCGDMADEVCKAILHCFPSPKLEEQRKTLIERSSVFRQRYSEKRIEELSPNSVGDGLVHVDQSDEAPHVGPLVGGAITDNRPHELLNKIATLEATVEEKDATIRDLQSGNTELAILKTTVEELKTTVENQNATIGGLQNENAELKSQMKRMETRMEAGFAQLERNREFSQANRAMATTNGENNSRLARDVGQLERNRISDPAVLSQQSSASTVSDRLPIDATTDDLLILEPSTNPTIVVHSEGIEESAGTGMTTDAVTSADLSDSASSSGASSLSPQPSPQADVQLPIFDLAADSTASSGASNISPQPSLPAERPPTATIVLDRQSSSGAENLSPQSSTGDQPESIFDMEADFPPLGR